MKLALAVVVVCLALSCVQAVHPLTKLRSAVLLEKKHHTKSTLLPHPYRRHHPAGEAGSKKTPGKACSDLKTCQECASLHICVWADVEGKSVCLDDSDRNSVYGTRESCEGEPDNGYRDVKDVRALKIEENKNMVAEADTFASNTLNGEKVVVEAITDPDVKSPFAGLHSELREKEPSWSTGAKRSTEVYHHAPTGRTVTRKTFSHTSTSGKPKPATGEADELGAETPEEMEDAKAAEGEEAAEEGAEEEAADAEAENASFVEKSSKKHKEDDDEGSNNDGKVTKANDEEKEEGVSLETLSEKVDKLAEAFDSRLSALEGKNDEAVEETVEEVKEATEKVEEAKEEADHAKAEAEDAKEEAEDAEKEAKEDAEKTEEEKAEEEPSMKPSEDLNAKAGGPGEADGKQLARDMEEEEPIVKQTTVSTMLVKDGEVVATPTVEQTVEELDQGTTDPESQEGFEAPASDVKCGGGDAAATEPVHEAPEEDADCGSE